MFKRRDANESLDAEKDEEESEDDSLVSQNEEDCEMDLHMDNTCTNQRWHIPKDVQLAPDALEKGGDEIHAPLHELDKQNEGAEADEIKEHNCTVQSSKPCAAEEQKASGCGRRGVSDSSLKQKIKEHIFPGQSSKPRATEEQKASGCGSHEIPDLSLKQKMKEHNCLVQSSKPRAAEEQKASGCGRHGISASCLKQKIKEHNFPGKSSEEQKACCCGRHGISDSSFKQKIKEHNCQGESSKPCAAEEQKASGCGRHGTAYSSLKKNATEGDYEVLLPEAREAISTDFTKFSASELLQCHNTSVLSRETKTVVHISQQNPTMSAIKCLKDSECLKNEGEMDVQQGAVCSCLFTEDLDSEQEGLLSDKVSPVDSNKHLSKPYLLSTEHLKKVFCLSKLRNVSVRADAQPAGCEFGECKLKLNIWYKYCPP
ncbi:hypothetical protein L7F22_023201 [Adiantum nelumboides]|nr:hypothetical protein [Adiantum nelumboides]